MRRLAIALAITGGAACTTGGGPDAPQPATKAELGALVFSDPSLSAPAGESCATCHDPHRAFTEPDSDSSTSGGAVRGRFGPRNAPSAMYVAYAPSLHQDPARGWVGGLFWDGRASALEQQALGPVMNPLEMNDASHAALVARVAEAQYAPAFRALYGAGALDDADRGAANIADAIAAFERTPALAPFSSKYDRWLAGKAQLSDAEARGVLEDREAARGNCASCHPSRPSADGTPPLFTDWSYANLGIPRYGNNKFLAQPPALNPDGAAYVDHGLMKTTGDPAQDGKFRVPSLRNVMRTGPYGHNGYFENVPYLIDFLDTRDVGSAHNGPWAPPEVPANVDPRVGDLGLSDQDRDDLTAFLGTLTDEAPAR
jgi:cytochrome c peroxidase